MEYQTIANPDGTISIVPINQQQGIMVPAYETSQLDLVNQINQGPRNIGAPMTLEETMAGSVLPPDPRRFQSIFPTTGIMQQAPLDMNRFQGVSDMSIIDETTNDEQSHEYIDQVKKSKGGGIGGLLKFLLGLAIPGAGLLLSLGHGGFDKLRGGFDRGLGALRNINQRIQGSDFGQATSLMDYLDMRKDGGAQGRRDASARTMAQARGITKALASRPSSNSGGYQQGPGGSGAQKTGASRSQRQAGPGFSGKGSAAEMGSF